MTQNYRNFIESNSSSLFSKLTYIDQDDALNDISLFKDRLVDGEYVQLHTHYHGFHPNNNKECKFIRYENNSSIITKVINQSSKPIHNKISRNKKFYDGTNLNNKPQTTLNKMDEIMLIHWSNIWRNSKDINKIGMIDIQFLEDNMKKFPSNRTLYFDIEGSDPTELDGSNHWNPDYRKVLQGKMKISTFKTYIDKWIELINIAKSNTINCKIGTYATLPIRDYWTPVNNITSKMTDWKLANDMLIPLGNVIDVAFPSIYTFYTNQKGWITYATQNIIEAKKYGKPVFPFLMPIFHTSAMPPDTIIPDDYISIQIQKCINDADGLVMWSGREEFKNHSNWYNILSEKNGF